MVWCLEVWGWWPFDALMMEFGGRWCCVGVFWEMKVEGEVAEGWVARVGGTRLLMKLVIIMSRATTFSLLEKTK